MRRLIAIATVLTLAAPLSLLASGPAATTGSIIGMATTASGQPLGNYLVRDRNMVNGQVAESTRSDASGKFTFVALMPGSHAIEIVDVTTGLVVGTSALIALKAGSTAAVTVTGEAAQSLKKGAGAWSTATIVTVVAVTAGVVGLAIAASRNDASPSR